MEKQDAISRCPAAKTADVRKASPSLGSGSSIAPRRKITPEERRAGMKFLQAALEDARSYIAMTEDEVEDEYRRAGKLHKYDPDKEWQKRVARVAKAYPPPKFMTCPEIDEFLTYLDDDEDNQGPGM